jgi:hypothetical protein
MADEIVNKVANSGIITIDLEEYYPEGERVLFDIKPFLFQELVLREKDFREFIKQENWSKYQDKFVAITCSSEAIVPTWAYMLVALSLQPFAKKTVFGTLELLENTLFDEAMSGIDLSRFKDARIIIKGCSHKPVPVNAFVKLSAAIKPLAKSIMYGEPCSTVPLYKAPK